MRSNWLEHWPSSFLLLIIEDYKQKKKQSHYPGILMKQAWSIFIKCLNIFNLWHKDHHFLGGKQRVKSQVGRIDQLANHSTRFGSSSPFRKLVT